MAKHNSEASLIWPPNERMQLTWLLGAPSRSVSVHGRAVGLIGLGSAATQLMRAVSQPQSIVVWMVPRLSDAISFGDEWGEALHLMCR